LFALHGLSVVTCPWKKVEPALQQVRDLARAREQSNPAVQRRLLGIVQTVWSGAGSFLDELEALAKDAGGAQIRRQCRPVLRPDFRGNRRRDAYRVRRPGRTSRPTGP
jgi:hypothetical protein